LANADVLPFEFTGLADAVGKYTEEVIKLADDLREETKEMNRLIREKTLANVADPKEPFVEPQPKSEVPHLNFAPLQNALVKLQESARRFDSARREIETTGRTLPRERQEALELKLMNVERLLTSADGLPRRPWYRHLIYAPGFYTGYG